MSNYNHHASNDLGKYVLFVKVGYHTNEEIDDIYNRKKREETKTGRFYWGYGGTLCHPKRQVVPFTSLAIQDGFGVKVAMVLTSSRFKGKSVFAKEISLDGLHWFPMPSNVNVLGSKYALVCSNLRQVSLQVNLFQYEVAVGPSSGRILSEYLRYRVDKACAVRRAETAQNESYVWVSYLAELVEPYAMFLR